MNPLGTAIKGKGLRQLSRRVRDITAHYGMTSAPMKRAIDHFRAVLEQYGGAATFPVTAAAVERNRETIQPLDGSRIEFAVHGYYHIDHSRLTVERQLADLSRARRLFNAMKIPAAGFRCPYLRSNADTLRAVGNAGYLYDSSHSLAWEVVDGLATESYQRALEFYGAQAAGDYPALPRIENGLVEIPYSLPDDESLLERLKFEGESDLGQPWLRILTETHRRGELFSLGLHPERIHLLEAQLRAVMQRARELQPPVWFARLDEVARWWLDRSTIQVEVTTKPDNVYTISAHGPGGLSILARGVNLISPSASWEAPWRLVDGGQVSCGSSVRPFVGVSPQSDPALADFLHQQGYIVEINTDPVLTSTYFDRPVFRREEERSLLSEIEASDAPLVHFNRWPGAVKSALCVTGDIDALTIWDYVLRFFGR